MDLATLERMRPMDLICDFCGTKGPVTPHRGRWMCGGCLWALWMGITLQWPDGTVWSIMPGVEEAHNTDLG